jgi:hypothetical protein
LSRVGGWSRVWARIWRDGGRELWVSVDARIWHEEQH